METIKVFKPKDTNVLEVLQWTGNNLDQVKEFCGESFEGILFEKRPNGKATVKVNCEGVTLDCERGQYLAKGIGVIVPMEQLEDLLDTHEEVVEDITAVCQHTNTKEESHEDYHRRDTIITTYCTDCGKMLSRF